MGVMFFLSRIHCLGETAIYGEQGDTVHDPGRVWLRGSGELVKPPPRDPSTFSEGTWTLQTYIRVSPITS